MKRGEIFHWTCSWNNFLKAFLKALGANVNEANAQRVAASLNYLLLLMGTVDRDCDHQSRVGTVRGERTLQKL